MVVTLLLLLPLQSPTLLPALERGRQNRQTLCDISQWPYLADPLAADNTAAIQRALDDCSGTPEGGAGTVFVPTAAGRGYRTGSLRLRSHTRLVIDTGAEIRGIVDNRSAYPEGPPFPSYCGTDGGSKPDCRGSCVLPLLGANGVQEVSILGGGTIDGSFPHGGGLPGGGDRPRLIQFRNSTGIHIANLTIQHSSFWTIHFYACRSVSVTDSRILAGITVGETDGVDVDSTTDAYIARNHIEVGDDGVAVKSGMGACGRAFAQPSANVTIEHNFFNFSGGVAIGSEMSGGVRDILVRHNILRGDAHMQPDLWTWGPRVLTIKSLRGRGGVIENIMIFNTTCIDCDQIARITMMNSETPMMNLVNTPVVRNVTVQMVRGTCEEPGFFQGLPESPLGMSFIDVVVTPLRNASAVYANCAPLSPVGIGVGNSPPVCALTSHTRNLPTVYGGAAAGQGSDMVGPLVWPSGALFGFSGIDGQTDTPSRMVGWFGNGSYSVFLWLKQARLLSLGFVTEPGGRPSADPALDKIVYATNDALLVERGDSRLAVTWKDRHTIVGFVEGPAAAVSLQDSGPNCGAVREFQFAEVTTAQQLRWLIFSSADGFGPTICFVEFLIGGAWVNSEMWSVTGVSHPNGPCKNLVQGATCSHFWNADKGTADGLTPWNVTIDLGSSTAVAGLRYGIFQPAEAPEVFELQSRQAAPTHVALETTADNVTPVSSFSFASPQTGQRWIWNISDSFDAPAGPTVCWLALEIDGIWQTNSSWHVSAASYPNGPVRNILSRSNETFWNADVKGHGPPWVLTLDLRKEATVTGFRYKPYDLTTNAPRRFSLGVEQISSASMPWQVILKANASASSSGNCTDLSHVNVSTSSSDVLAFAKHLTTGDSASGVTNFALCYASGGTSTPAATACAQDAAKSDVGAVLAARNDFIAATLPPLADSGSDAFARKLLSVMKVNSLSAEGQVEQGWSTTCRAPHQNMFLWDGMMQTISMNHVNPDLALQYFRSFVQFQDNATGQMCSEFSPAGCLSHTDAMPPNMALALVDWYRQRPDKAVLAELFPHLERYIMWHLTHRRDATGPYKNLLFWRDAYEAGMDHEQTFCPGRLGDLMKGCRADHYAVDFTSYIIWECESLSTIANELGQAERASYWNETAATITADLILHLWDPHTAFFYDRYFNGTLMDVKTVAGFYPLLCSGMPPAQQQGMAAMLKAKDFATPVPVPTVGVFTDDFSTDLDRGPMCDMTCIALVSPHHPTWEQQNFYIIRGLRKSGYDQEADALKAASLGIVRHFYDQWGVVFEFYDALNTTDPTQCLRKPAKADSGTCRPGVMGLSGHCGTGGIRDYNFCAGLALLWLRGGE